MVLGGDALSPAKIFGSEGNFYGMATDGGRWSRSGEPTDKEVRAVANDAQRLLLTCDKDFGELVFRQRQVHAGVVLMKRDIDRGRSQPRY